jgi:hypothetical protein
LEAKISQKTNPTTAQTFLLAPQKQKENRFGVSNKITGRKKG